MPSYKPWIGTYENPNRPMRSDESNMHYTIAMADKEESRIIARYSAVHYVRRPGRIQTVHKSLRLIGRTSPAPRPVVGTLKLNKYYLRRTIRTDNLTSPIGNTAAMPEDVDSAINRLDIMLLHRRPWKINTMEYLREVLRQSGYELEIVA